jgi:hypothetical protein
MNFNKILNVHLKIAKIKISSLIKYAVNVYLWTFSKSQIHVQFLIFTNQIVKKISS